MGVYVDAANCFTFSNSGIYLLSIYLFETSVQAQGPYTNAGDTQSRSLYKKLAQVSCTRNLDQILMQHSLQEKTHTRKHDTQSSFSYKSTCTSFLYKILDCVSLALV